MKFFFIDLFQLCFQYFISLMLSNRVNFFHEPLHSQFPLNYFPCRESSIFFLAALSSLKIFIKVAVISKQLD